MMLLTSATIGTGSALLRDLPGRRLRLDRAAPETCLAVVADAAPGCFFTRFLIGIFLGR
jgi:hypothetical protein